MKLKEAVALFIGEKQKTGTLNNISYRYYLYDLCSFYKELDIGNKNIKEINVNHITDFLQRKSNKMSTILKKEAILSSFFSWCYNSGLTDTDILRDYKIPFIKDIPIERKEKRNRKIISDNELSALLTEIRHLIEDRKKELLRLNVCIDENIYFNLNDYNPYQQRQIKGYFNNCFCEFAIIVSRYTGLRIMDIANLEWESIKDNHLLVWAHKTQTRLIIPMNDLVKDIVSKQLKIHSVYMFPFLNRNLNNDTYVSTYLASKMQYLFNRSGIFGKNFHDLRATFISSTLKKGFDIPVVMKIVGHKNFSTTIKYLNFTDKDIDDLSTKMSAHNLAVQ